MATTKDPFAPVSDTASTDFGSSNDTPVGWTSRATSPAEETGGLKEKVSQATSHVKSTAAEFGRSAADNIDRNLKSAAGALQSTAQTLRERGTGTGKTSQYANTAADKLDATAQYFRTHDTHDMLHEADQWTRHNPGIALGAAVAIGFFIGLSLARDRRA